MNDPRVSQINARFMAAYRSSRLSLGVKESTVRRDESDLGGMFTLGKCRGISRRKSTPRPPSLKRKSPEMTYLTTEEIAKLLDAVSGDARRITLLCLSTGARWGEAKNLRAEHIINNRVTFNKTKTEKFELFLSLMRLLVRSKQRNPAFCLTSIMRNIARCFAVLSQTYQRDRLYMFYAIPLQLTL